MVWRSLLFHNTVCFWFGVKRNASSILCPREQCLQPGQPTIWGLQSETGRLEPLFQQFGGIVLSWKQSTTPLLLTSSWKSSRLPIRALPACSHRSAGKGWEAAAEMGSSRPRLSASFLGSASAGAHAGPQLGGLELAVGISSGCKRESRSQAGSHRLLQPMLHHEQRCWAATGLGRIYVSGIEFGSYSQLLILLQGKG